MGKMKNLVVKDKALTGESAENIIEFNKRKPKDIQPYIDCEKGWKFTEDDKDFLIAYYEDWIQGCIEEFGGDFIEEPTKILKSLREKGVYVSKELIQTDARCMADAVCDDIYHYYDGDEKILKLIENSILDVQW